MSSLISALIAGGMTLLSSILVRRFASHLQSAEPYKLDGDSGTIRPDRWSGWIITVFGAILVLCAVALMIAEPDAFWIGAILFVIGALFAGCMFPSVTSLHALSWSKSCVDGASQMVLGTLGLQRATIAWPDVARSGTTFTMYWYLEAHDGRRVYWSYLYPGNAKFAAAIKNHRPDIEPPPMPSYVGTKLDGAQQKGRS
ncbi:MAG: hypothetical protein NT015_05725 [Alphaproteobacteria bacterium]|nr:hypothetical protein [Alphaproteobacteria bacterium]